MGVSCNPSPQPLEIQPHNHATTLTERLQPSYHQSMICFPNKNEWHWHNYRSSLTTKKEQNSNVPFLKENKIPNRTITMTPMWYTVSKYDQTEPKYHIHHVISTSTILSWPSEFTNLTHSHTPQSSSSQLSLGGRIWQSKPQVKMNEKAGMKLSFPF